MYGGRIIHQTAGGSEHGRTESELVQAKEQLHHVVLQQGGSAEDKIDDGHPRWAKTCVGVFSIEEFD